jgi:hypothetical protein
LKGFPVTTRQNQLNLLFKKRHFKKFFKVRNWLGIKGLAFSSEATFFECGGSLDQFVPSNHNIPFAVFIHRNEEFVI